MNRKFVISGIILIILGIGLFLLGVSDDLIADGDESFEELDIELLEDKNSLDLQSKDNEEVSNIKADIDVNDIEVISEELLKDKIECAPYDFKDRVISEEDISSLVLSPIEEASHGFGLTFRIDFKSDNVELLVLNDDLSLYKQYEVSSFKIEEDVISGSSEYYVYRGFVEDLEPGQDYFYYILYEDKVSQTYSIRTIDENVGTSIAFFGDSQGYLNSQYEDLLLTYEHALEVAGHIDLNYIAGDIVDDGGSYNQWEYFYNNMDKVLASKLFISAIGNHDVYNGPGLYVNAFNYPKNGLKELDQRSFYVDLPYARLITFDTESTLTYQEQANWLLDVVAESNKPFNIVLMHRSVYPMAYNEAHIRQLSGLFELAEIDLVLSGHDHIYSRTTMAEESLVDVNSGVTYIVGGSSTGSKFYDAYDLQVRYWKDVVYDDNNPVFTLLNIDEEFIDVKAYSIIDGNQVIIDECQIYKK